MYNGTTAKNKQRLYFQNSDLKDWWKILGEFVAFCVHSKTFYLVLQSVIEVKNVKENSRN